MSMRCGARCRARGRPRDGLNRPHYPRSVTRLLAVEPSPLARKIASKRIAEVPFLVELVGSDDRAGLAGSDGRSRWCRR